MSDIINLLPDSIANQIAAGEVVQRPASVVKELLENSIDAGASSVELNVFNAGKTGVQVVDNGQGMSGTDARLCFERHATSKIHDANDLNAIATMGFRGEALASIAAVAEVTLITRRPADEMGTKVTLAASKVIEHAPTAAAAGTNFFVRNLFFNVPARRRFLKSDSVELKHIVSEFQRVALANPQVAMRLTNDGALLYDLHPANRRERILDLFGRKLDKLLLPITVRTDIASIEGFIGAPSAARRRAGEQFLFANARYMRNPALSRAIYSAFEKLIASDLMPIFFIFFTVDPASIDVNIHPQKTEIKFENDQVIWHLLNAAVREVLGKSSSTPQIDFDTPILSTENFFPPSSFFSITEQERIESVDATPSAPHIRYPAPQGAGTGGAFTAIPSQMNREADAQPFDLQLSEGHTFQIFNRYIVTQLHFGFAIVEQRRAHARVLYEQLCASEPSSTVSQRLAAPLTIPLTPLQRIALQTLQQELSKIGFTTELPDGQTLAVQAVPRWLEVGKCTDLILRILDEDDTPAESAQAQAYDSHLRHLAFASAIAWGQPLSPLQQQSLLQDLFACQAPAIDPQGAPTYVLLTDKNVNDLFKASAII